MYSLPDDLLTLSACSNSCTPPSPPLFIRAVSTAADRLPSRLVGCGWTGTTKGCWELKFGDNAMVGSVFWNFTNWEKLTITICQVENQFHTDRIPKCNILVWPLRAQNLKCSKSPQCPSFYTQEDLSEIVKGRAIEYSEYKTSNAQVWTLII